MQSDDGSRKCIIVIGGLIDQGCIVKVLRTSEILDLDNRKWVQGPELPVGLHSAACVALPPSKFACVVLGGCTGDEEDNDDDKVSNDVYGLNNKITEWTFLGKMRGRICNHIALPLS